MAPIRTGDRSNDDTNASGTGSSSGSSSYGSQDNNRNCCTVCGTRVGRVHDLKRHMKIHDPKNKRCTHSECSYVTRNESSLVTHMRRHGDNKPYPCKDDAENCQYASVDPAGLLRHRVSHHGYKPRKVNRQKRKPGSHRVPVTIASHLRDNNDEVSEEHFGVYRTGIRPGRRADSDEELDQLDSSDDESASPRSHSGSASSYSAPSTPSDNDPMVLYMVNQGNYYVPQVYYAKKPEMSLLDAALVKYPFSSQALAVPPFSNAHPADQSLLSFQGWNAEPQVKLEVIEQKDFEIPGQGTHELYSFFAQDGNKYMVSGPLNVVQLDAVAPQAAPSFAEDITYPTDEFGYIDFGTIANETYIDTQPVEGLQSMSVNLGSHDDRMLDNNDVYPAMAIDHFGNPINSDLLSINDNNSSFSQVYDYEDDFSCEALLENFDLLGGYSNTFQNNEQPYY